MGAGPEPLTPAVQHSARVPGAQPFDAAASRAVGGAGELAAWIAGCSGAVPPRVAEHLVVAEAHGAGRALPTVGHVARAVDEGRDRAAAARAADVTLLVIAGTGDAAAVARLTGWLSGTTAEPEVRGPLGALYRLGDEALAVLCGVALGAGEHGLALLCDGPAGTTAAALALAVQPELRPRVRVAGERADTDTAALRAQLGLPAVRGEDADGGYEAAVAALRRACGQ